MNDTQLLSKSIDYVRFPLMLLVVYIHTTLAATVVAGADVTTYGQFPIHDALHHLVSEIVGGLAVPTYFLISGFLFFWKEQTFTASIYKAKLKSRCRTLLVPYIFWSLVWLLVLLVAQTLFPAMLSGKNALIVDYTWQDWIDVCLANNAMNPLWFVRDLFLLFVLSPLVYVCIKYLKIAALLPFAIFVCLGYNGGWTVLGVDPIFFFMWGAYLGYNKINFAAVWRLHRWLFLSVYVLFVVADFCLWFYHSPYWVYLHKTSLMVGIVTLMAWVAQGIHAQKIRSYALLTSSAFFLLAMHNPIVVFLSKLWVLMASPMTDAKMSIAYLLIPLLLSAVIVLVYALLKRYFPRFTSIIVGGR